jgi:hypothetical protein
MRMTRHPGRSSFTFEIKRAARPTPEPLSRRKTSLFASSSLADQVFGKFSGPLTAPQSSRNEVPPLDRLPSQSGSLSIHSREMHYGTEPLHKASPRRVLPDLLSAPPDPVEERMREKAEEQAARRRATRSSRMMVGQGSATVADPAIPDMAPVRSDDPEDSRKSARDQAAGAEPLAPAPEPTVTAPEPMKSRRGRRVSNLKAAARRAQKKGLSEPRLPAGSQWKRRLNWTCW